MRFTFFRNDLLDLDTDLLAVASFEDKLSDVRPIADLDRALGGTLTEIANEEGFRAKDDQALLVHTRGALKSRRVLLVGLGKREDFDLPLTRRFAARVVKEAENRRCKKIAVILPPVDPSSTDRAAQFFAEGARLGAYRFDRYQKADEDHFRVEAVEVVVPASITIDSLSLARADVIASAVVMARDLVNEPADKLGPRALAQFSREMAKSRGLECKVLGTKECEKLGMNLFLAVSRGSREEPQLIHLTFRPRGKDLAKRRYVLVGKGVTFDSGGLSLKPAASMADMKSDMAGAATVIAVMSALGDLGFGTEVHAVIAATENMVSGEAYRVGDVYTGMSGKSVEIINTDAEGRLTLADALTYAQKTCDPDEIIDVATLTGACVVALGPHMAGLMGNDWAFVERFLAAARRVGEEMWHLPLAKRLKEQLKSDVADIKNLGERWGGALTAGLFLQDFVEQGAWLHLDVAGPAFADKASAHVSKGGTGFGVASIIEYLFSRNGN